MLELDPVRVLFPRRIRAIDPRRVFALTHRLGHDPDRIGLPAAPPATARSSRSQKSPRQITSAGSAPGQQRQEERDQVAVPRGVLNGRRIMALFRGDLFEDDLGEPSSSSGPRITPRTRMGTTDWRGAFLCLARAERGANSAERFARRRDP